VLTASLTDLGRKLLTRKSLSEVTRFYVLLGDMGRKLRYIPDGGEFLPFLNFYFEFRAGLPERLEVGVRQNMIWQFRVC
jgi:hypothetical protein